MAYALHSGVRNFKCLWSFLTFVIGLFSWLFGSCNNWIGQNLDLTELLWLGLWLYIPHFKSIKFFIPLCIQHWYLSKGHRSVIYEKEVFTLFGLGTKRDFYGSYWRPDWAPKMALFLASPRTLCIPKTLIWVTIFYPFLHHFHSAV